MAVAGVLPVLLGGDANVYGMARSFYEAYGVHSVAVCKRALPALADSRLVKAAVENPRLEEDSVFTAALIALAEAHPDRTCLLISCADGYTMQMARCREALAPYYKFACPDPATVQSLGTKEGFARVCAEHGLRTPRSVTLPCGERVPELPFAGPVIVKPADSPAYWNCRFAGKRKVYLTQDAAELAAVVDTVRQGGYAGDLLLQEYIPGPDTALGVVNAYCAKDGSVPWMVQGQVLLQERTPEGIGNYAAILTEPARQDTALLEALAALLRRSGWRGYANFDFKYDRSGETGSVRDESPAGAGVLFLYGGGGQSGLAAGGGPGTAGCRHAAHAAPLGVAHGALGRCAAVLPRQDPLQRADSLRRRGRGRCHLLAPGEGPARRVWFAVRQGAYRRKMKKSF